MMSVDVIHADFEKECNELAVEGKLDSAEKFDFIFADPPFNIGHDYSGYVDSLDLASYEFMIRRSVFFMWQRCRGVLALHGPDDLADLYLDIARTHRMNRVGWVNWHYRFGQAGKVANKRTWTDSRCHCLIFARDGYTFNGEDVAVASDRAAIYNDKRTRNKVDEDGNEIPGTAKGGTRVPFSVWGIPSDGPYWGRVTSQSKERMPNRPNQLPEVYLERLIRAYTNPGDRILDPFGGTGTTAVVADALGRQCVTYDIDEKACETIHELLDRGAVRVLSSKP